MSSASSDANVCRTQEVFVLVQAYFVAIAETGNIFLTNGPTWSAQASGMLCSTMNSVNSASARIILKSFPLLPMKNFLILHVEGPESTIIPMCF